MKIGHSSLESFITIYEPRLCLLPSKAQVFLQSIGVHGKKNQCAADGKAISDILPSSLGQAVSFRLK